MIPHFLMNCSKEVHFYKSTVISYTFIYSKPTIHLFMKWFNSFLSKIDHTCIYFY